ncbi:MAG: Cell division protein ftsA [Microgenomates group bacterium GW2011_GWA1_46_7]|nr:MAG: Cell division protein ftsA [Microgenomates group bacterium GW2011_GWA1_46_7]
MKKSTQLTAVDIGTSKITCVIATVGEEDNSLRVVGVASVPSKGIRKSQVVDIEDTIEAATDSVEMAERMAGLGVREGTISISGIHIDSQNSKGLVAVQNPDSEITADDVDRVVTAAKAVPLETAREILHVVPRYYLVDNQDGIRDPVGMSGVRLEAEAHLITGSIVNTKNLTKVMSEIGVDTNMVTFAGLASATATLTDTEKELGVVLVDIGGGTTSLCVYVDGALSHSAGSNKVLDPKNPQSKKQADEIDLHKLGLKDAPRKISRKAVIEGIIRPRLNELFELIKAELIKAGVGGKTPAGLVLTGGGSLTYQIDDAGRKILGLQSRIAYPVGLTGLVDEIKSPEFSTVTGLLLLANRDNHPKSTPTFHLPKLSFNLPGKNSGKKILDFIKSFLP